MLFDVCPRLRVRRACHKFPHKKTLRNQRIVQKEREEYRNESEGCGRAGIFNSGENHLQFGHEIYGDSFSQVHIARAFSKSKFPNPHGNATSFMTLSNQEHQEPKQVLFELSVPTCIWSIWLSRQASELLRKMILPQEFVFARASHTMLLLGRTFRTPRWLRCLRSGHASDKSKA